MAGVFVVAAATVVRPMSLLRGIAVHCRTMLLGRTRTALMGAGRPHSCTELMFRGMGCAGHRVTVQSCRTRTRVEPAVHPLSSFHRPGQPHGLVFTPRGKTRHYRVGFGLDAASTSFWCLVQYAAHGTASSRFESIGPPSTRHCP